MAYCTNIEVRRRMAGGSGSGGSGTTTALPEEELTALIEQASRYFDLECGVDPGYFEAAGVSATNRTFYGNGTRFLGLGKYVDGSLITSITLPDGYTAPDFAEIDGYLVITDTNGVVSGHRCHGGWWYGVPIIVSAQWGLSATPEDVKLAVIELVINLERETDPADIKLMNLDNQPLREKMPPRVWEIARRYRAQQGVLV